MKKILIVYASNAGSTMEISHYLGKQLSNEIVNTTICGFQEVQNLQSYDAIILGTPMMRELHPGMVKFIQKNQKILINKKVAMFITCLRLTDTGEADYMGTPVFMDKQLIVSPQKANKLNFIEQKTNIAAYLSPSFEFMPWFKPIQLAFFGGALNFRKLKPLQILLVLLLLQFKSIDKRNWESIEDWAGILQNNF